MPRASPILGRPWQPAGPCRLHSKASVALFRPDGPTFRWFLDWFGPEEAQTAHASPSVEQKDLLDSAKPSQVLITQAFYKRIAHCQPLALRSFPARAGVYEFLWTSDERLNELQAEAEFMPTLVIESAQAAAPVNTVREHPATPASEPRPRDFERPTTSERPSGLMHRELAKIQSRQRMLIISGAAAILIIVGYLVISHAFLGHRPKEVGRRLLPPDYPAAHSSPPPLLNRAVDLAKS